MLPTEQYLLLMPQKRSFLVHILPNNYCNTVIAVFMASFLPSPICDYCDGRYTLKVATAHCNMLPLLIASFNCKNWVQIFSDISFNGSKCGLGDQRNSYWSHDLLQVGLSPTYFHLSKNCTKINGLVFLVATHEDVEKENVWWLFPHSAWIMHAKPALCVSPFSVHEPPQDAACVVMCWKCADRLSWFSIWYISPIENSDGSNDDSPVDAEESLRGQVEMAEKALTVALLIFPRILQRK